MDESIKKEFLKDRKCVTLEGPGRSAMHIDNGHGKPFCNHHVAKTSKWKKRTGKVTCIRCVSVYYHDDPAINLAFLTLLYEGKLYE